MKKYYKLRNGEFVPNKVIFDAYKITKGRAGSENEVEYFINDLMDNGSIICGVDMKPSGGLNHD